MAYFGFLRSLKCYDQKKKEKKNLGPEAAMLGPWLGNIRADSTSVNKIEEEYAWLEFNISGDGPQHVVLAGRPSAGDCRPGLWPVPDESSEFLTWKREAVKTQADGDRPC